VSTSKGVMTGKKAYREGLGGEIICYIWWMRSRYVKSRKNANKDSKWSNCRDIWRFSHC
jgi:hypothetical protein